MKSRAWGWVAVLGCGIGLGLLSLRDPEVAMGLRSLRVIVDYCPCNQSVAALEPGAELEDVEALVGKRLRALDERGRLRPVDEALGEDRALWLGERLFVDCLRPDSVAGRHGVIRSYVIELDGAGRVRRVEAESLAYWGCAQDEEEAWLQAVRD